MRRPGSLSLLSCAYERLKQSLKTIFYERQSADQCVRGCCDRVVQLKDNRDHVITMKMSSVAVCELDADAGPCHDYVDKWFYNVQSKNCERFSYGGCDGNDNKFSSQTECERTCLRERKRQQQGERVRCLCVPLLGEPRCYPWRNRPIVLLSHLQLPLINQSVNPSGTRYSRYRHYALFKCILTLAILEMTQRVLTAANADQKAHTKSFVLEHSRSVEISLGYGVVPEAVVQL